METFTKVIPGKVIQEGIVSRENLTTSTPVISSPAHFPDFACVTPRGPVKRATVSVSGFTEKFGDIMDPNGQFYNPIAVAIGVLGQAGQSSFSFRRLTANEEQARTILGVILFEGVQVPNYERDGNGDYKFDATGMPVPHKTTPAIPGVMAFPARVTNVTGVGIGEVKSIEVLGDGNPVTTGKTGKFYPLFELISGIGDSYNSMYAAIGHSISSDWKEIARFITTYGAFPYTLNIGERLDNGLRVPATTTTGTPDATMTLFDMAGPNNVRYGVQVALDHYTGRDVNRPVETRPAPFETAHVYTMNLDKVCQILHKAEYTDGTGIAPEVLSNKLPVRAIMNPLTFVDHNGKPYIHIVQGTQLTIPADSKINTSRVSLNHYFQAVGGIDPYADKDGNYPEKPASWLEAFDGPWVAAAGTDALVTVKQYWEMTQALLLQYLTIYRNSLDMKDVIRNRTSVMWDMGYNEEVKDVMTSFLGKRKDILVIPCATEWLKKKTQEQLYSTAQALHTKLAMQPESETFQSHACRAAINLWDACVINEPTFGRFSINIDNMFAFAIAGGGADGKVYAELMPDNDGNRTLRVMHDPLVQFEDDDPAANNLVQGAITVTPLNTAQFCRPALPTVHNNTDSVLKDLPNVWTCIVVEKILQDLWITISGNTQLRKTGYVSRMKDGAEARIRELLGSVIVNWEVDPTFRENQPNAKSVMYTTTRLWFSKGVYMMNSVLEAYNEDSLAAQ